MHGGIYAGAYDVDIKHHQNYAASKYLEEGYGKEISDYQEGYGEGGG